MSRAAFAALVLLAGCGPSVRFDSFGVGLNQSGVARADPLLECEPGFGDCPSEVCLHATFDVGSQHQEVDGCATRDDVHSGHLYRPNLIAPQPVQVGQGGQATVELTSGGSGKKSAPIPVVPNE